MSNTWDSHRQGEAKPRIAHNLQFAKPQEEAETVSPETGDATGSGVASGGEKVLVNGLAMTLVVAWNPATEEVKYFLAWGTMSVRKVLRVGFRRWTVEHLFRVAKQEVGLMDYEGRKYTGLMRHLILCLVVLGFVSIQVDRLRGKNPEITLEQVSQALNQRCEELLIHRRGVSTRKQVGVVIRYHQKRNATARKSHQKRRPESQEAL